MAIQFPGIKPSSLTFTPATYNVATPKFRNTVLTPRLLASQPNSSTLSLDFRNISADSILSIFEAWESSYSGFYELTLPSEITSSIGSVEFAGRIVSAQSNGWRFATEPTLTNITVGVGNVSVQLKGEFFYPLQAGGPPVLSGSPLLDIGPMSSNLAEIPGTYVFGWTFNIVNPSSSSTINYKVTGVGIWGDTATEHKVGIWEGYYPTTLLWQRLVNPVEGIPQNGFLWFPIEDGPTLYGGEGGSSPTSGAYIVGTTWGGGESVPVELDPEQLGNLVDGLVILGGGGLSSEFEVPDLDVDLSNTDYWPTIENPGLNYGIFSANLLVTLVESP